MALCGIDEAGQYLKKTRLKVLSLKSNILSMGAR